MVKVGSPLRVGGKLDTLTRTYVGPCDQWRVWLVGEVQRELIDYVLGGEKPKNVLLYSAEGAGKTVLAAQIATLLIFEATRKGVPGALGATAPTHPRLGTLVKAITDLGPYCPAREVDPRAWGSVHVDSGDIYMASGHVIQTRSTKPQSAAIGSPIQGWNWGLGCVMDEGQDSKDAYADVVARLRAGKEPPVIMTATAKDDSGWRNFRDGLSANWRIARMKYNDTPFVHMEHWVLMKSECSPRDWMRRALAMDVGPERMVYTSWDRSKNIRPIPTIGARDVTASVLGRYGKNIQMLVGHDPGQICDVSVMFKAYQIKGEASHVWFAVDELTTNRTTSEEHATALRERLQSHWGLNTGDIQDGVALIRCDPYGDSDTKTDRSVYSVFQQYGFDIRSAAFKKGKGNGRVPKEAGIEMINSLLCNANGVRRLFVASLENGAPAVPKVVSAIELSERDEMGKAETQKKGKWDLSHWTAATRYAFYIIEKPRSPTLVRAGAPIA